MEKPVPVITVSKGRTVNLGNFESAREDVSITVSAGGHTAKNIEDAYEFASKWCEEKLNEVLNK